MGDDVADVDDAMAAVAVVAAVDADDVAVVEGDTVAGVGSTVEKNMVCGVRIPWLKR